MTTAQSSSPTGSLKTTRRHLHSLADYDTYTLVATAERLLGSPHELLCVPSEDLLRLATTSQLRAFLKEKLGTGPSYIDHMTSTMGGGQSASSPEATITSVIKAFSFVGKKQFHNIRLNRAFTLMQRFDITRPILSLTEQERALFRAAVQMTADKGYSAAQWARFLSLLVWNGGKGAMEATTEAARVPEAMSYLREYLGRIAPDHQTFLAQAGKDVSGQLANAPARHPSMVQAISNGAKWMDLTDITSGTTYSTRKGPSSLMIGRINDGGRRSDIYYDGHESLITIGGPGTGKSQAQVITNLLRFPGSAIVLDVKGELYKATAEYRSRRFGPVYRFAPTDPSGASDRYNPLDFIRNDPDGAADDLNVFSYQVIADNPHAHDPYWECKGRDFVWAFAMMACLKLKGPDRKVESLYEMLSLATESDVDSDIMKLAESMIRNGQRINIPDLVAAGNSLKAGLSATDSHRIESVLDTARRHFAGFNRASYARKALSASDWTPEIFRQKQGSTLYICMDSSELKANAAIVRLILAQHGLRLMRTQVKPTDVPITFFLDEMPQLGNFEFITQLQDVGRGAGLRLWMFAQNMGQLSRAFGSDKYKGVIDACRVRCFMQPDADAANFISHPLGEVRNLFNGEKRPLATVSDLMGRAHRDHIIVTTRGDHPMIADKVMAYKEYANRMLPPKTIISKKSSP